MDQFDLKHISDDDLRDLADAVAQKVAERCRCRDEYGQRVTAFCPLHHSVPNGPYTEGARGVLYNCAGEPMNEPEPYFVDEDRDYSDDYYLSDRWKCIHGAPGGCDKCEDGESDGRYRHGWKIGGHSRHERPLQGSYRV